MSVLERSRQRRGVHPPDGQLEAVPPPALEWERVGPLPLWGWAALTALTVWTLYRVTLAPTTAFWDTSEYIATAHILGIPHPPGNPFFVMVGRVWDVALAWSGLTVAQRVNLLSATASAGAAFFWFLSILRIWSHFTENRLHLLVAGVAAVLVGATAFTVWSQSNVNEKVYTISLFFVALITYLAMLWEDVADSAKGDRLVILMVFLLGLAATNHLMSLLPALALCTHVLWHRPRTLLRPRLLSAGVAVAIVGFSVQVLFVPIRSAQNPLIDEANPECSSVWTAVATPLEFLPFVGDALPDAATCEPLRAAMAREQYAKPPLTERQAPSTAQAAMYGQYFDWQWARTLPGPLRLGTTLLFVGLGLVGLRRHWTGDRDSFVYFGTLLVTVIPVLIFYLNFKYGYSFNPEIPVNQREVRERDYFFILSFNLWGLYAGLGIATMWRDAAERMARRAVGTGRRRGVDDEAGVRGQRAGALPAPAVLMAAPVLGLALLPLIFNYGRADRSGDYSARDWAYNLLQSVEPYGVLFTNGDNDTFPLWYLQEVEGIRQDVTVAVHSYLGTEWYVKQLKAVTRPCEQGERPSERFTVVVCQRPFDPDTAPPLYGEEEIPAPDSFVIDMSDEEIDNVPSFQVVEEPTRVRITDRMTARLDPQQLRTRYGQPLVTRSDLFAYFITRSSVDDRPVYFASTAPPVFGIWNLSERLMRQGLAYKTVDGLLESTVDTVRLTDGFEAQWLDRDRTHSLLWDVFQVECLLDWDTWPDPSSRSRLPTQYYLAYLSLGYAERLRDNPGLAERNHQRAQVFLELSDLGGGEP